MIKYMNVFSQGCLDVNFYLNTYSITKFMSAVSSFFELMKRKNIYVYQHYTFLMNWEKNKKYTVYITDISF